MLNHSPRISIPFITIHPDKINIYNRVEDQNKIKKYNRFENLNGEVNDYKNKISINSRRKISKSVDYLLLFAQGGKLPNSLHGKLLKFKISFITLTLPSQQCHTDNEIKNKCLNQFIIELKRFYHVKNYIWRAEKQQNGNIHFHILTDKFIPWSEIRDRWNRIIEKLGYVSKYRDNLKKFHSGGFQVRQDLLKFWSLESQKKAYMNGIKNNWNNPNSTDIHSLKNINNAKKYLISYITKEEQNKGLKNRVWGCNYELSNLKGDIEICDNEIKNEIDKLFKDLTIHRYISDHFSVLYFNNLSFLYKNYNLLFQLFSNYLIKTFNFNVLPSLNLI